jgi:uncharacterized membrane protein YeaQ/YmgE (transglycosylase-associated protein family)
MQVLGLIVIGVIIGLIARLVLPGRQRIGAWFTVLLGVAGALIGGLVASALGTGDIFELNFLGTIVGIIAAAGLIGGADRAGIGKHRRRDALKAGRAPPRRAEAQLVASDYPSESSSSPPGQPHPGGPGVLRRLGQ